MDYILTRYLSELKTINVILSAIFEQYLFPFNVYMLLYISSKKVKKNSLNKKSQSEYLSKKVLKFISKMVIAMKTLVMFVFTTFFIISFVDYRTTTAATIPDNSPCNDL